MELNKIYHNDALSGLKTLDSESIDCIVTSPPYWGLRNYSTESQIWDGIDGCDHQWGEPVPKGGRIKRPEDYDPKYAEGLSSEKTNPFLDKKSNFCSLCGAWRGSLGLEPTFQLYIQHLIQIFDECKRVLKPTGTCWVNIGSSYSPGKDDTMELRNDLSQEDKLYVLTELAKCNLL